MSVNTFGRLLRVTTWGESHGPAIGAVVDGCPPGIALDEADIQPFLDRRRPGGSRHVSQRREADRVRILSGTYQGRTTGTPIALQIANEDARPQDYAGLPYRPGHADYAYDAKYGHRDPRGGGRASARETAARVAAGAVARALLGEGIRIRAWLAALGGDEAAGFDPDEIDRNPFFAPDADAAARWADRLDALRRAGDSVGALVACAAEGVPAGWGAPVYARLDADLAAALMSINAVKGVEVGDGFAAAAATGSAFADPMRPGPSGPVFGANHNGGVAGGIATGQPLRLRAAFKPTSSIRIPVDSVDARGAAASAVTLGRHDPCVGIRGVPVVEAMVALVLADHMLLHRAQCG
jgi:chorismate synthase